MESIVKCSTCLSSDTLLVNMWDTDSNNIKWFYKLKSCVPEVDWFEDNLICKKCINLLEAVYEFRDMCLKSFAIRKYLSKQNVCDTNGTSLNNTPLLLYHCKHCLGISFKNSNELAEHNVTVHFIVDRPYNCICCEKDFKTSLELMNHEVIHLNSAVELNYQQQVDAVELHNSKNKVENDSAYNCHSCGRIFNTRMLLISHLDLCKPSEFVTNQVEIDIKTTSSPLKQFDHENKCDNDSSIFSTGRKVNNHNECKGISVEESEMKANDRQDDTESSGNERICEVSDVSTISRPIEKKVTSLRPRKRGPKKLDQITNLCPICGMVFNTRYLAKRHIHNVHAIEKNYQCDMCDQKFASPVYLNAHKRYHSGERLHICSFCGKGFITGSDLYHHEKIHANKRAYKCEKCLKAFNTSSDLHKHNLCVHLDRSQWKYVCSFCDRRFPLKTNLDAHTKTHTGERNFACHLCDRKCVNRSVLMRHVRSHSNVRLFKCSLCQLEYKYQKSLDIHMTKVHGIGDAKIPERIKRYFCHICPKSYFANNKLQKHIRTHTGERPFSCQMCEKRFIDKSYVKQHLKVAHNVVFCQTDT